MYAVSGLAGSCLCLSVCASADFGVRILAMACEEAVSASMLPMKQRQQLPMAEQAAPRAGDRVLRLQRHWLDLVLSGEKTAEVRRDSTSAGGLWLGCGGEIWACAHIRMLVQLTLPQITSPGPKALTSNDDLFEALEDLRGWWQLLECVFKIRVKVLSTFLHPRGESK